MKCSFSRLLYPKTVEEARDGSYMIALFRPHEKVLDAQGNRLSSIKVVGHYLPTVSSVKVDMAGHWKKDARYGLQFEMESYEELVESSKAGIVSYLSSGDDTWHRGGNWPKESTILSGSSPWRY